MYRLFRGVGGGHGREGGWWWCVLGGAGQKIAKGGKGEVEKVSESDSGEAGTEHRHPGVNTHACMLLIPSMSSIRSVSQACLILPLTNTSTGCGVPSLT